MMTRFGDRPVHLAALVALFAWGCGDDDGSAIVDASAAAGEPDAGEPGEDAGKPDSGRPDAGPECTEGCEFVDVSLGTLTSCARRENGEVWCWGHNFFGEIGDGQMQHADGRCTRDTDLNPQDCPGPKQVISIGAATQLSYQGARTPCAVDDTGAVWCWGIETIARTEGEARERRFEPAQIPGFSGATDVSAGEAHACAVVSGAVLCFGSNEAGQLGTGERTERRNDEEPPMVAGLPEGIVDVEVASFDSRAGIDPFTCAHNGTALYCWGSNQSGQLGDGVTHETCRDAEATPFDCSPTPMQVSLPETVTSITSLALGARHACVVDQNGAVHCWGENAVGQLGNGTLDASPTPTAVPTITEGAAQVTAAFRHTCARMATGELQCWGGNEHGPLGDGTFAGSVEGNCSTQGDRPPCSPTPVSVLQIDDAVDVAAGWQHTCAARESGEVWCWGWNDRRGLGDGTIERRPEPVLVQGLP